LFAFGFLAAPVFVFRLFFDWMFAFFLAAFSFLLFANKTACGVPKPPDASSSFTRLCAGQNRLEPSVATY